MLYRVTITEWTVYSEMRPTPRSKGAQRVRGRGRGRGAGLSLNESTSENAADIIAISGTSTASESEMPNEVGSPKNLDDNPVGELIPAFQQMNWPSWRNKFFSGWIICSGTMKTIAAKCKLCEKFQCGSKDSFSNFQRHLNRSHKEDFEAFTNSMKVPDEKQPKISIFTEGTPMNQTKRNQIDEALTSMIVVDNLPISTVRKEGFQSFCKVQFFFNILNALILFENFILGNFRLQFRRTKFRPFRDSEIH